MLCRVIMIIESRHRRDMSSCQKMRVNESGISPLEGGTISIHCTEYGQTLPALASGEEPRGISTSEICRVTFGIRAG